MAYLNHSKGVVYMAVSEAHKRASNKWNSSRDNIMVRPSKEIGEANRAAAAAAGMSVQAYILKAVQEKMEREAAVEGQGAGVLVFSGGVQNDNNSSRSPSLAPSDSTIPE